MASLTASLIQTQGLYPKDQVQLHTFGEPRIGDSMFAAAFDKAVTNSYRITHAHDPVPHLPLMNMEGYMQHKSEVFYKENMKAGAKYRVCQDQDESDLCSDGNLIPDYDFKDHLVYFELDISDFGYKGCKN